MTNNIALDVCIGLIFIFLLYSLMASTLLEIFARIFDLRARNLLRGLRRMLEDTKPEPRQHSTLIAWAIEFAKDLIYYFAPTKGSPLLEKFYNHPSIKYLGENTVHSKPAYIYSSTFSKTIIQILRTGLLNQKFDSRIQNESEEIRNSLEFNTSQIDPDTLSQLKAIFEDARQDSIQFRIGLEQWFDETMERAGDWYKRQSQILLFFIGLILAGVFNVDAIQIAHILSTDDNARNEVVQMAIQEREHYGKMIETLKKDAIPDTIQKDLVVATTNQQRADSIATANFQLMNQHAQDVKKILGTGDGYIYKNLIGWFITALAISLGAPFWFDLLNKFISLRESKPKKDDSKTQTSTQEPIVG